MTLNLQHSLREVHSLHEVLKAGLGPKTIPFGPDFEINEVRVALLEGSFQQLKSLILFLPENIQEAMNPFEKFPASDCSS